MADAERPREESATTVSNGAGGKNASPQKIPMSVAARHRAEAEAAFRRIAPTWTDEHAPAPKKEEPKPYKSEFEVRVSERDSLTTGLRVAEGKKEALGVCP